MTVCLHISPIHHKNIDHPFSLIPISIHIPCKVGITGLQPFHRLSNNFRIIG